MVDALPAMGKAPASAAAPSQGYMPASEPVHLSTMEKVSLRMAGDGGLESIEVRGDLTLNISSAEKAAIRINVAQGDNRKFQIQPHPKIDKTMLAQTSVLGLKGDASQKFPVGNALKVLRWKMSSTDEGDAPLNVSCWPSDGDSESQVNLEYELVKGKELRNVVISIPIPSGGGAPKVGQIDGEWEYNSRNSVLEWMIPVIDSSNANGAMEFSTRAADSSAFFPVNVSFVSKHTYVQLGVSSVTDAVTGEPVKFSQDISLSTDEFVIA
eukprot:Plantae.Rhodophyta-Purpureofilum_apyrenoidigerum.ctg24485.p1 GENE.Plantae.Rhodophyta-Purpureofilum_apyrenoidigerum.ctg24485~~Plantae.Rhodophyta-Purpureofilum_apyrenoidigerum.ctg24485.p1  ORF type:complete len:293 (+),score=55.96 Plantae.Rhodophyta-Purpureofilum_apyrenoidigerum.ctg24485:76-879(+)